MAQEVVSLQAAPPAPIHTPLFHSPSQTLGRLARLLALVPSLSQTPQSVGPKASWAMVARRGGKKCNTNQASAAPAQSKSLTTAKPLQPKKGITARECRLMIKWEGGPLNKTELELRNEINTALASTYIQTVSVKGNTIMITTMESIRATSLNRKVGTFLYLIIYVLDSLSQNTI